MKTWLIVIALLFPPTLSAQTLEYDEFTGTDYYKSKRVEIYRNRGGLLLYNPAAVAARSVKVLRKPGFTLSLSVESYDWQFIRSCTIRFLADSKRYEYPCHVVNSRAYSLGRDVYVREDLQIAIPAEEFRAILKAKLVEMQVGTYEFKVKEKHKKELLKVDVPEITTPSLP